MATDIPNEATTQKKWRVLPSDQVQLEAVAKLKAAGFPETPPLPTTGDRRLLAEFAPEWFTLYWQTYWALIEGHFDIVEFNSSPVATSLA